MDGARCDDHNTPLADVAQMHTRYASLGAAPRMGPWYIKVQVCGTDTSTPSTLQPEMFDAPHEVGNGSGELY